PVTVYRALRRLDDIRSRAALRDGEPSAGSVERSLGLTHSFGAAPGQHRVELHLLDVERRLGRADVLIAPLEQPFQARLRLVQNRASGRYVLRARPRHDLSQLRLGRGQVRLRL